MRIRDILDQKGHDVVKTTPDGTVLEAMQVLNEHNIGAVVVVEGEAIRGILSERDVLRLGGGDPALLSSTPVGEAMTRDVIVGFPDDEIHTAMGVMTKNRIRHLPVVADGELLGIVSIGDLVNACWQEAADENRHLKDYIRGSVS
ncbi:MAG: CBS domain-containing protein [Gemmatimonadota bacterium]|jgi:CBS domain-containing protein|nr:MAG: CBS domain-containing protein [Gemmatimonadota bacterium]